MYFVGLVDDSNPAVYKCEMLVPEKNFIGSCLTEQVDSDHWNYTVRATTNCSGWNNSTNVTKTIESKTPRAELLESFDCMFGVDGIKCSWTPLNSTQNPTISYWVCGTPPGKFSLQACQPDSSGGRLYCILDVDRIDLCFLVNTSTAWKVFRSPIGTESPKLSITDRDEQLILTWQAPETNISCTWMYEFNYTRCKAQKCTNVSLQLSQNKMTKVPYTKGFLYNFTYRVLTNGSYCQTILGTWNKNVTYGMADNTQDWTLISVALIVPTIVFFSIILSCYCFRKYSSIICPNTPDPSAIFKEMVMDGNKAYKTENLYTPKPEQSCRVTLISQSGELQQNP
nr:PREDICTED: interleukin-13 receptor subunit alpha-1-like [Paralichthys olivaceus]